MKCPSSRAAHGQAVEENGAAATASRQKTDVIAHCLDGAQDIPDISGDGEPLKRRAR